jgi:hypothetical protein
VGGYLQNIQDYVKKRQLSIFLFLTLEYNLHKGFTWKTFPHAHCVVMIDWTAG